jgi:uncharacterized DUF497 family protein
MFGATRDAAPVATSVEVRTTSAVGFSSAPRVLGVVHVERGERLRIISARRTTLNEEQRYVGRRGL